MTRRQPSEATRRKSIHYARKAIRLMKAESLALTAIDARMVRLMVETMAGSDAERHLVFRGLNRFLAWTRKQGLVERNVCDELDRDEKPRDGQSRDHVPSLEELRAVWAAVENEAATRSGAIPVARSAETRRSRRPRLVARSTCSCGASVSRQTERKRAKPTNCHCLRRRWRCSRRASRTRKAISFFQREGINHSTDLTIFSNGFGRGSAKARPPRPNASSCTTSGEAFVSHLAERGYDVDLLDQCLGHSRKGVFGVYQRASRMAERARALEAWAGLIAGEGEVEQTGKVIPMQGLRGGVRRPRKAGRVKWCG